MDLLSRYRQFVTSPTQLAIFQHYPSVDIFLQHLKNLWQYDGEHDALLTALNRYNQQPLDINPKCMRSCWIPHSYQPKTRSIAWCLPHGYPIEPFHDQYLERCRQQILLNQIVKPRTSLNHLLSLNHSPATQPAGFIFHLSRCGSTLVSGSLAELTQTCVLSESSLLTQLLLDVSLADTERQSALSSLVDLQGNVIPRRNKVIVKWNAWDLFFWPIIRRIYPHVPVVFIVRDPVEILASHHRLAGRHMAGDPSLAALHPVFADPPKSETSSKNLLDFRIGVLHALLEIMFNTAKESNVKVIDYKQISLDEIINVCQHFKLSTGTDEIERIRERMRFHSKEPRRQFNADSEHKQRLLNEHEKNIIRQKLFPIYNRLLMARHHAIVATV